MSDRGWASTFVGLAVAALALAGLVMLPAPAWAQIDVGGYTLDGGVEVGWRFFIERPSKGERTKFEEYRDIPPGPFLDLAPRLHRQRDLLRKEGIAPRPGEDLGRHLRRQLDPTQPPPHQFFGLGPG